MMETEDKRRQRIESRIKDIDAFKERGKYTLFLEKRKVLIDDMAKEYFCIYKNTEDKKSMKNFMKIFKQKYLKFCIKQQVMKCYPEIPLNFFEKRGRKRKKINLKVKNRTGFYLIRKLDYEIMRGEGIPLEDGNFCYDPILIQ